MMTIAGNIFLAISMLAYIVLMLPVINDTGHGSNDSGAGMLALFVTPFIWGALSIAIGFAIGLGAFDWLLTDRRNQYLVLLASVLGLSVVIFLGVALMHEDPTRIPWAMRPLMPWALYVFPTLAMLCTGAALNGGLSGVAPAMVWRGPLMGTLGICALAGITMLGELIVSTQQRANQRIETSQREETARDQQRLSEVEAMNVEKNFAGLLQYTNRFSSEPVQSLAVKKVLSHPQFTEKLTECLRGWCVGEAMYFVDAHDPPEPASIAEPLRDGILRLAGLARKSMETQDRMFEDQFDSDVQRILSAADRFAKYGVDYVPAIRQYRAAMDVPRDRMADKNKPTCRFALDQWLKANKKN